MRRASNDGVPPVAELVAMLERCARGFDGEPDGKVTELLLDLHRSNSAQWDLEDATREPEATDAVVARAKRDIDARNQRRHDLVQELDTVIGSLLPQVATAPPATETPGMVLDRLSVLVIRIHRTERAGDSSPEYAARVPRLRRQLDDLAGALDVLLRDVRAGTRRFLPYEPHKLYGVAAKRR